MSAFSQGNTDSVKWKSNSRPLENKPPPPKITIYMGRLLNPKVKTMSHEAIFFATQWRCIASCKEDFLVWHPMFATSLATKNCVASCRESRSSFYFSQCYATNCSVWHPHWNLSRNFFEKEPITIRHNQNATDIFKYSAGVKSNLIAGRKTSCVRLTS